MLNENARSVTGAALATVLFLAGFHAFMVFYNYTWLFGAVIFLPAALLLAVVFYCTTVSAANYFHRSKAMKILTICAFAAYILANVSPAGASVYREITGDFSGFFVLPLPGILSAVSIGLSVAQAVLAKKAKKALK